LCELITVSGYGKSLQKHGSAVTTAAIKQQEPQVKFVAVPVGTFFRMVDFGSTTLKAVRYEEVSSLLKFNYNNIGL
jgi:hypothetical protein